MQAIVITTAGGLAMLRAYPFRVPARGVLPLAYVARAQGAPLGDAGSAASMVMTAVASMVVRANLRSFISFPLGLVVDCPAGGRVRNQTRATVKSWPLTLGETPASPWGSVGEITARWRPGRRRGTGRGPC